MPLDTATAPPVVVVGGGPVGLAAATLLAREGVPCLVVERRGTASCGQSRAVTIQRDILALYDRLGIAEVILEHGASWSLGRTYFGDAEVRQVRYDLDDVSTYPPFINFAQHQVEELLHGAVTGLDRVQVLHGATAEVVDDGSGSDHAVVKITEADGAMRMASAAYVIAADGVGSATRKALGIEFEGWRTNGRFLVADFAAELPFSAERRLWFAPPFYPDGVVLMHNIGSGVWRLDWQIHASLDVEQEIASGGVLRRIRAVLDHAGVGDVGVDILRCNGWTFQQRQATRFHQGRVFLAGDAAHVVSPFGARGMNSGMEDAENLAWKMAMVLTGAAPGELLDTYREEREQAAAHHVHVTGESMNFMVPDTRKALAARDHILTTAMTDPASAHLVDSGTLYAPEPYSASSLTTAFTGRLTTRRPLPGDLVPDFRVTAGGKRTTLRKSVASRFTVLTARADAPGRLERHAVDQSGLTPLGDLVVDTATTPLSHPTDVAYLVRPDCYLAAVVEIDPRGPSWTKDIHDAWLRATAHAGQR